MISQRDEFADFEEVTPRPAPRDEWADFEEVRPAKRRRQASSRRSARPAQSSQPTGEVYDGDTFRLSTGDNARLLGVDAFERRQTGTTALGNLMRLGLQSREALQQFAQPGALARLTGAETYGRPIATVENGGDAGAALLHDGLALAVPEYLRDDPDRLARYTQEERLARLNRRGAHALTYQTPEGYRRREPLERGERAAVFFDDPTPNAGLKPKVAAGYEALQRDPRATAADLVAYAKDNGFSIDPAEAERYMSRRNDPRYQTTTGTSYAPRAPRVLTDPGDGATGAVVRGLLDPVNLLDEFGAVANAVLPTPERENIWSSDRRFGDILDNNKEQWRSIIDNDEAKHPWSRFSGQLASGVLLPGASVEGVGFAAARNVLRAGGSRFAAEQAARQAVVGRLGAAGAVEGTVAGAGGGETWQERTQGGLIGAPVGGALGVGAGVLAPKLAQAVGRPFAKLAGRDGERAAEDFADGAVDTARARASNDLSDAEPRTRDVLTTPEPVARQRDRIDVPASAPRTIAAEPTPIDTAAPARPLPPSRALDDAVDEIDAWARSRGAYPQAEDGLPEVMLHGSPRPDIDAFDPYGRSGYGLFGTGTYLTDSERIASTYSKKGLSRAAKEAEVDQTLYAVRQAVRNPLDMDAPADRAKWEATAQRVLGEDEGFFADLPDGATNERFWREVEDYLTSNQVYASDGQETMDALVRSLGHDGITHIGGGRVDKGGPRHRVVIALDPEQTEIVDRLSVGSILNPPAPRSPDWIDTNARQPAARERDRLDMAAEVDRPELIGPDFTRAADEFAGFEQVSGPTRPLLADAPDAERIAAAERLSPRDVLPLPSNTVASLDEAEGIARGRLETVKAPREETVLSSRSVPSPRDATRSLPKRGPLDLVTWLRTQGGIRAQGGELEHFGIDNTPRKLDFAGGEGRFGRLVSDEGMTYDDAAQRAWEAGFFPDHVERPTVPEFLDALSATHSGGNRAFRLDDLEEVDAFEAARAQRHAVELADQEGAPLTRDRGEPVTADDLDANAPPVEAYQEWGENAPNLAGNLRLDKLDSPQAIKRARVETHARVGGFDAATRGRITQAETERLAGELGMTADDLLKRRKGQAFNAEEALAARQILARSATDLVNMAKRLARMENPGDELEAAFRQAWMRHAAIQEQVTGATAEAGRALAQFRQVANGRLAEQALPSLGDTGGGSGRLREIATAIVDLEKAGTTPAGINKFAADALKPRWKDRLIELYINNLLSGPQTHVVNVVSNTLTALSQLPEQALAAGIGRVARPLERGAARLLGNEAKQADSVLFSEVGARTVGMMIGVQEGLRDGLRALKTGNPIDPVTKLETQSMKAIGGRTGEFIRLPTRFLTAEDELFKGIARRMELTALAMRKATLEGRRGPSRRQRVAELIANPPDEMTEAAFKYARYLTFQTPLASDSIAAGVSRRGQNNLLVKALFPFVRTPVNLLKFAAERSPGAPLMRDWRRDYAAGGARRDVAVARALVGTAVGAAFYSAAVEGKVSGGGPADREARRLLEADGWQPYSIRIGDQWVSYGRLDPYATIMGTAADMVELERYMTDKQRERSSSMLVASILNNLSNKTWLSGASSALEAVSDPQRYLDAFLARQAGSLVPTGIAQLAKSQDPYLREARGIVDRIRSRVPGLSRELQVRRDVFGRAIENEGGIGPDLVSPAYTRKAGNDPLVAELLRAGAHVTAPSRKVYGRELSAAEYNQYQAATGSRVYPALQSLIRAGEWAAADAEERRQMVSDVNTDAKREAKIELFGPGRNR